MLKQKHHPKSSEEVERVSDAEALSLIREVLDRLPSAELSALTPELIQSSHEAIDELGEVLGRILKGASVAASSATWVGQSWIGPNCLIGPQCIVGPNAFLTQSVLLTFGVRVGFCVEIDTSVLFDQAKVSHTAFVGSSNFGRAVNAGFGFVATTGRLNGEQVRVRIDSAPPAHIVSRASHHGVVVGNNTRLGASVLTMPGSTIAPNLLIEPMKRISGIFSGAD